MSGEKIKELINKNIKATIFRNDGKNIVVSFQKLFIDVKNNNRPTWKTIYFSRKEIDSAIDLLLELKEELNKPII